MPSGKEVTDMAEEIETPTPSCAVPALSAGAGVLASAAAPPVLDEERIGDIRGALGSISMHDTDARRGVRARLLALLAIMGPGLIVMVADNDAGGVSTYAQAGQDYGTSLLWTLLLLIPVLIVNQEMVIRLGAVTGVGYARLISERFGRAWGWFSVGALLILNFCTIVTEFIGVSLALGYFGVSDTLAVPLAAVALLAITASGSFRSWERFMYVFVVANFLVIPLLILSHPGVGQIVHHTLIPGIQGGASSRSVLLIIAIVGTTVAPWQLFFQQSNIVDKRITPRWINYERADTVIGAFVVVLGAGALISVTAFGLGSTVAAGHFKDAGATARALGDSLGSTAGSFFAVVLLNASLIGAAAVTLATSYAVGDILGGRQSLDRGFREARSFYAGFGALVALAAAIVLLPGAPLGLITVAVQALAGLLLPSSIVFLLLLCNDRAVLGPWVNRPWLNALATVIIAVLLVLSIVLITTTVFPSVNVPQLAGYLAVGMGLALAFGGAYAWRTGSLRREATDEGVDRMSWTMPPLALLERPHWSFGRRLAMRGLTAYLAVAVAMLVVKAIQLGGA
ncbi:MAG TPA: NRAMP family divalent metal transporter [Solirubrobacteraceae bacterium]|jgi:NRAMP (natural resistance-associated macrophage protein)-like metal ion transporter|nr:NRAMP family divalent metal transporter [Solirubrobacteraceae bacterium]